MYIQSMNVLMVNKYFSWLTEHESLKQQQNKIYSTKRIFILCAVCSTFVRSAKAVHFSLQKHTVVKKLWTLTSLLSTLRWTRYFHKPKFKQEDVCLQIVHKQLPNSPFLWYCVILYMVVLTFESVNEILKCDHSNESYWAVLSSGAVYYAA